MKKQEQDDQLNEILSNLRQKALDGDLNPPELRNDLACLLVYKASEGLTLRELLSVTERLESLVLGKAGTRASTADKKQVATPSPQFEEARKKLAGGHM